MRQFGCVELELNDALLLRDAIRPLAKVEPYEPASLIRFCQKLYTAILKLKAEECETVNVPLEEQEAMFLNQFVSNEDWGNALPILEQSWLVLYELQHQAVYPRRREHVASLIERMGATAEAD
jgi:hypothetical protein